MTINRGKQSERPARLSGSSYAALMLGVFNALVTPRACAIPPEIVRCVPKDACAVFFMDPTQAREPVDGGRLDLGFAGSVLDHASQSGLLGALSVKPRAWLDALATIAHVMKYPHALALLSIDFAQREDGGHQLSGLEAALIIHVPAADKFEQRIQQLLNKYTNTDHTTLQTPSYNGNIIHSIRDRRLPMRARETVSHPRRFMRTV